MPDGAARVMCAAAGPTSKSIGEGPIAYAAQGESSGTRLAAVAIASRTLRQAAGAGRASR